MKRALLISPSAAPGGGERALLSLYRRLPEVGFEPSMVLLQHGPFEDWLVDAGCTYTVRDAGRFRYLHRTAATVRRLASDAGAADVVVSNQSKGHVYGGLAACLARRPAVWWQHGVANRSRIEYAAARVPCSAVVCSSEPAADAQRRATPRREVRLIHLGTDLSQVRDARGAGAAVRQARGWGAGPVVGIVGRLEPWKGQDVFLRAAARIARARPDVRFAVVGGAVLGWEGDYPASLHRLAAELGIADRTDFTGHQESVYPWFDALDVVVHASIGEPFGLVLVEAMALGKPLVAAASGGPLEIVEPEVSGLLFPPGDDEALADSVLRVLGDAALAGRLGQNAPSRAERFSDQRMAESFAALLDEMVVR